MVFCFVNIIFPGPLSLFQPIIDDCDDVREKWSAILAKSNGTPKIDYKNGILKGSPGEALVQCILRNQGRPRSAIFLKHL